MRFLADENFPGKVVRLLRERGHDVLWVRTDMPGITDEEILELSSREQRVILSFDKDFGDLALNPPSGQAAFGVALFRVSRTKAAMTGEAMADLICGRDNWAGHFSVIEPGRIRMRPLRDRKA